MNKHERMEETPWVWQHPSYRLFLKSVWQDAKDLVARRPYLSWSVIVVTILAFYIYRYLWHPLLLDLRYYSGAIAVGAVLALIGWFTVNAVTSPTWAWYLRPIGAVLGIGLVILGARYGKEVHTYLAQYWRYQTLELVELERLPTTEHERTWALHGIHSFMMQRMNETEGPTPPDLARVGDRYDWTMGIEPTSPLLRYFDPIEEVVSLDSTITSFDLERRKNVFFDTGENLLFSRNIHTCVRRAFWFWQAIHHEPSKTVLYMENDAKQWVQVVPVIRWRGYAAPRPEAGGVFVLPQTGKGFWERKFLGPLKRVFLGCGTWIPQHEVEKHAFLRGQNIVPYEVSRFMASSIRFQGGLFAPQKWRKEGDIRIPDRPEDLNQQPFTMHFNVRAKGKVHSKLFHYFALEPSDSDKQALAVSFWVPADGIGPQYVYRHFGRSETLIGVSAVASRVRASQRMYDWTENEPVEHRPYLRETVDEKGATVVPFRWLTTVVTVDRKRMREEPDKHVFVTGIPEIAITDARREEVVWVDRMNPDRWPEQLSEVLGPKKAR